MSRPVLTRSLTLVGVTSVLSVLMWSAFASVAVSPEVKAVSATFTLNPSFSSLRDCTGSDGQNYRTIGADYRRPELSSDLTLKGQLHLTITATYNLSTGDGVAQGNATLTDPHTHSRVFHGQVTLVFRITDLVDRKGDARGFVNVALLSNGQPTGERLVANFEMGLNLGTLESVNGSFGDAPTVSDLSVRTNLGTC